MPLLVDREVAYRLAIPRDSGDIYAFGSDSALPSFHIPGRIERMIAEGFVMLAHLDDLLVGCAGMLPNHVNAYHTPDGEIKLFELPNRYFGTMLVDPTLRGLGIGKHLYGLRLERVLESFDGPIYVELLGDGTPDSVDAGAVAGLRFYLSHGFAHLGYSVDEDAGKVILLPPRAGRAPA